MSDHLKMTITTLHETIFEYERAVHASLGEVRLKPVSDAHQSCREFSLSVDPLAPVTSGTDYWGNELHSFNILPLHRSAVVTGRSIVETHRAPFAPPAPLSQWEWQRAPIDFLGFDGPIEDTPEVRALAREAGLMNADLQQSGFGMNHKMGSGNMTQSMGGMTQTINGMMHFQTIFTNHFDAAQKLNNLIHERFEYAPETTDIDTRVSHVFESGRGVCQDFAHVFIAACRIAGLPARYVSGYLVTKKSRSAEGTPASHAWAEVLLPNAGWAAFDPTNNLLANNYYIKLAGGRDYRDVAPTRGLYRGNRGGWSRLRVRVHTLLEEDDRSVSQPELVG